ncbi:hypothetical protein WA158_007780 [Blastocystis sp. Blastoise]
MDNEDGVDDIHKLNGLKENVLVLEELVKDVANISSSVMDLFVHSKTLMNGFIKHIKEEHSERKSKRSCESQSFTDASQENTQSGYRNKRKNKEDHADEGVDHIRFTSSGLVFEISKSVLDSIKDSFIYEQSAKEYRTNDGTIFLDYRGNEASAYILLDYLEGKKVDFDIFSYEEQLKILDLFEFCELIIPIELVFARDRRDTKKKKIETGDKFDLIINGQKNTDVKNYLVQNGLWKNYIMNYNNGFAEYNHIEDNLFMNKKYEYIEYIYEYINKGIIDIDIDKIADINKELLEKEMIELFGDKGKEEAREAMIGRWFKESTIINRELEKPLVNWLGNEKKWKLLFRASEHSFSLEEFHEYCDNEGETVTLIKHLGHRKHENIFGGYTDQSWDCSYSDTTYSKEFIFTLSNEHAIPPTKYDYVSEDKSRAVYHSSGHGPTFGTFGDIEISDGSKERGRSCCKAKYYSEVNTPQKSSLFVNTDGPDDLNWFIPADYEVWGSA